MDESKPVAPRRAGEAAPVPGECGASPSGGWAPQSGECAATSQLLKRIGAGDEGDVVSVRRPSRFSWVGFYRLCAKLRKGSHQEYVVEVSKVAR